ncbi:Na+/H+ antiporter NhaA [Sphingobacterium bovistauri]|uniref:Na(+)/H(+) antiporter NhaA n=1 Tax=Sphingobacterium bovistauri TaxID=2781959 RepID=A0ABS7ZAN4_9SPHI|nr:Na+/H+ antiporter NhaA [Sphingobacterium bovistauri]MCA5005759.1 Na+/H+ antiporter NhaA [Sphingobacterium bovistauri]
MSKLINLRTFKEFFESSTGGGILLFVCVILALIIANSPAGDSLLAFLATKIGFENQSIHLNYTIKQWIDDGLMAIFFLLVGLEIKRELVEGELASPKKAALPIFAAFGGALLPAAIYAIFNYNTETHHGWGIPMATDIAFALAVISLLDKRVPASLKVFLAALAIVDDLLAIIVIAIFYSSELHYTYLLYAGGIFAFQIVLNKLGVKNILAYVIPGVFMWYFIHHSGIHATIAGVLTAMSLPTTTDDKQSPLEKLEHILAKPVNFIIIPIFAFVNTAIVLNTDMIGGLTSSMGLGIITGLIIGKSAGILFTCWLCVKSGISSLPEGAGWKHMFGVGLLGGIGFTMSIFVAMLSFSDAQHIEEAKLTILVASCLAGLFGYFYLLSLSKKNN